MQKIVGPIDNYCTMGLFLEKINNWFSKSWFKCHSEATQGHKLKCTLFLSLTISLESWVCFMDWQLEEAGGVALDDKESKQF